MAAPVLRSTPTKASAASATSTATYSVAAPSGLVSGDLLVAVQTCDEGGSATNLTAPPGWTQFLSQPALQGSVGVLKVWWRIAAAEPASYSFTVGANGSQTDGQVAVVPFVAGTFNATAPLGTSATFSSSSASTTMTAASVTGAVDALLLCAWLTNNGSVSFFAPSGMTEQVDAPSIGSWTSLEVASQALATAGSTGTRVATASAARPYVSATWLVLPPSGGGAADTTPPSMPGALKATAVGPTQVNLSWTASTDNVGVVGYRITRNGSTIAASATGTTYADTGLTASTAYSYTVAALDAAGNASTAASTSVSTPATPDTTAPTVPASVVATAQAATKVVVTWAASTDNTAVTGYTVTRSGTALGTVTGTSYTDATAAPATAYSYTVTASDAAGNTSAASTPATVTTPAAPAAAVAVLPSIGNLGAPHWAWAAGPWTGLPTMPLTRAVSRSLKFRLRGASEASFTVNGLAPEASAINELLTDVWALRNGAVLFRGRVGPTSDDCDGSNHTVSFTAGDYRSLLDRRQLWDSDPLTYTGADRSDIAWGLLSATQGQPGGSLGVSRGVGQSLGVTQTITYPAGQSVGQALSQLAVMDNGFDYDITPTVGTVAQTFDVWPSRGTSRGRALNYPGNIAKFRRQFDPGTYANAVRETGNTGLAAVRTEAPDIGTRLEGRWDTQLGDTTLLDAGSVSSRAAKDLADRQAVTPVYTLTLRPGEWGGPADIWLGDTVIVDIESGRIATQGAQYRVMEIDVDIDENDNETVTIVTGVLDPDRRFSPARLLYRLTQLERR